jgi:hypothetical protein
MLFFLAILVRVVLTLGFTWEDVDVTDAIDLTPGFLVFFACVFNPDDSDGVPVCFVLVLTVLARFYNVK